MASDLKTEIFAYYWYHRTLFEGGLLSFERKFSDVYREECLAYSEFNEISDWDSLYYAILFRNFLFEKVYLEEIQTQINEFRHSQTDFYDYILRTCNRSDLFGNLTVFERVFATCAFVCCLCTYCYYNKYFEILKYAHICWAMYFDQFTKEFYEQGGWKRLEMVSVSYKLPMDFIDIVNVDGKADPTLTKIRKAIISYRRFKKIGEIDLYDCISVSWSKFCSQYINGDFDTDYDEFFEEFHSNEIKHFTEVENILNQLKYLCDPNASETLKYIRQLSYTSFLESSMANLKICDKRVNPESKIELKQNTTPVNFASKLSKKLNGAEDNVLTSKKLNKTAPPSLEISKRNSLVNVGSDKSDDLTISDYFQLKSQKPCMENTTIEHLFENMTISNCIGGKGVKKLTIVTAQLPPSEKNTDKENRDKILDSKEEQYERSVIKESRGNTILREQNNIEKKNDETQNDINEQDEWEVKSTDLSRRITPKSKNTEKRNGNKIQNDVTKELGKCKTTKKNSIRIEVKNTEMKNSKEIRVDERSEQEECEVFQSQKESIASSGQIYLSKKRAKKENRNERHDDIGKKQELNEIKSYKDNVIGQMFFTGKSAGEKNEKVRNSSLKEQEDGDIKNFLRLLLVIGDKQGIAYVRKTS